MTVLLALLMSATRPGPATATRYIDDVGAGFDATLTRTDRPPRRR